MEGRCQNVPVMLERLLIVGCAHEQKLAERNPAHELLGDIDGRWPDQISLVNDQNFDFSKSIVTLHHPGHAMGQRA